MDNSGINPISQIRVGFTPRAGALKVVFTDVSHHDQNSPNAVMARRWNYGAIGNTTRPRVYSKLFSLPLQIRGQECTDAHIHQLRSAILRNTFAYPKPLNHDVRAVSPPSWFGSYTSIQIPVPRLIITKLGFLAAEAVLTISPARSVYSIHSIAGIIEGNRAWNSEETVQFLRLRTCFSKIECNILSFPTSETASRLSKLQFTVTFWE